MLTSLSGRNEKWIAKTQSIFHCFRFARSLAFQSASTVLNDVALHFVPLTLRPTIGTF